MLKVIVSDRHAAPDRHSVHRKMSTTPLSGEPMTMYAPDLIAAVQRYLGRSDDATNVLIDRHLTLLDSPQLNNVQLIVAAGQAVARDQGRPPSGVSA